MIIVMKKLSVLCSWNILYRTCGNAIEDELFVVRFEFLKAIFCITYNARDLINMCLS